MKVRLQAPQHMSDLAHDPVRLRLRDVPQFQRSRLRASSHYRGEVAESLHSPAENLRSSRVSACSPERVAVVRSTPTFVNQASATLALPQASGNFLSHATRQSESSLQYGSPRISQSLALPTRQESRPIASTGKSLQLPIRVGGSLQCPMSARVESKSDVSIGGSLQLPVRLGGSLQIPARLSLASVGRDQKNCGTSTGSSRLPQSPAPLLSSISRRECSPPSGTRLPMGDDVRFGSLSLPNGLTVRSASISTPRSVEENNYISARISITRKEVPTSPRSVVENTRIPARISITRKNVPTTPRSVEENDRIPARVSISWKDVPIGSTNLGGTVHRQQMVSQARHHAACRIQRAWRVSKWRRSFFCFSEQTLCWVGRLDWLQQHNQLYGTELADPEDVSWWYLQQSDAPKDKDVDPWGYAKLSAHLNMMWYGGVAQTFLEDPDVLLSQGTKKTEAQELQQGEEAISLHGREAWSQVQGAVSTRGSQAACSTRGNGSALGLSTAISATMVNDRSPASVTRLLSPRGATSAYSRKLDAPRSLEQVASIVHSPKLIASGSRASEGEVRFSTARNILSTTSPAHAVSPRQTTRRSQIGSQVSSAANKSPSLTYRSSPSQTQRSPRTTYRHVLVS